MNITRTSLAVACFIVVLNHSTSANAETPKPLPKYCFQTEQDYETYLLYDFKKPAKVPDAWIDGEGNGVKPHIDKMVKAWRNGPAKRAPINIVATVARNFNGTRVVVDASQSTTPSGKIQFSWTDHNTPIKDQGGKAEVYYYPDGIIGVEVTVTDPVCEFSAREVFQEVK